MNAAGAVGLSLSRNPRLGFVRSAGTIGRPGEHRLLWRILNELDGYEVLALLENFSL